MNNTLTPQEFFTKFNIKPFSMKELKEYNARYTGSHKETLKGINNTLMHAATIIVNDDHEWIIKYQNGRTSTSSNPNTKTHTWVRSPMSEIKCLDTLELFKCSACGCILKEHFVTNHYYNDETINCNEMIIKMVLE